MESDPVQSEIQAHRKVLALSDVGTPDHKTGERWFHHAEEVIREVLGDVREVVVLDYAMDTIGQHHLQIKEGFDRMGFRTIPIHDYPGDEQMIIKEAEAFYVHGGDNVLSAINFHGLRHEDDNTLVDTRFGACPESLIKSLRCKVGNSFPYIGVSAGAIAAGPDYRTGNGQINLERRLSDGTSILVNEEMAGLELIKSGINPHFPGTDETKRKYRLQAIADVMYRSIIALRDESFLDIRGKRATLKGGKAVLLSRT